MNITVCVGSSCHLKGSREIVEQLQDLIAKEDLSKKISLSGSFCMKRCSRGVCVKVDDELYSVTPDTVDDFFGNTVKEKILEYDY